MLSRENYLHHLKEAETIYAGCFEWRGFLYTKYKVATSPKIENCISAFKNLPEALRELKDWKCLLKYYQASGLTNVQHIFLSTSHFDRVAAARKEAIDIQRKIIQLTSSCLQEQQILAETLFQSAIADMRKNEPQFSEAQKAITEAVSLLEINKQFIEAENIKLSLKEIKDFLCYLNEARQIALHNKDFSAAYTYYKKALDFAKELDAPHLHDDFISAMQNHMQKTFKNPEVGFALAEELNQLKLSTPKKGTPVKEAGEIKKLTPVRLTNR